MKKNIYFLGLLLFAACANDDEPTGQQVQNTYPLTIEVTENPLIPDGEEGSRTRTAITTTSSLTAFNLDYVYGSEYSTGSASVTNDNGAWTGGSWPGDAVTNNDEVNWYAYTDGSFYLTEDVSKKPYINFTVEETVNEQKDLLVATASGTYSGTGGNLALTFDHACAALRFYVKKATNINDKTLSVSSIVLKNVIKQGKYYYGTKSWTLGTTSTNYTLLSSAQALASDNYVLLNGSEDNSYLFLIPQTLTAWNPIGALSNTYLELTCSITQGETPVYSGTAYIPFAATLVKGKKYDVKINIGKNSLYSGANNKIITE